MSLGATLRHMNGIPFESEIDPSTHWLLRDDATGRGTYIKEWNFGSPRPNPAQIRAAEPAATAAHDKYMLDITAEDEALVRQVGERDLSVVSSDTGRIVKRMRTLTPAEFSDMDTIKAEIGSGTVNDEDAVRNNSAWVRPKP